MGLAQTKKNTKKKTPAKVAVKKHSSEKKYTWDELQAGADAPASTHKTVAQKAAVTRMAQEKAGSLMQNLKAAPRIKVASTAASAEKKVDPVHAALERARDKTEKAPQA